MMPRALLLILLTIWPALSLPLHADQPILIAASPSLGEPLLALGHAYEAAHPGARVQLYFDPGLDLRRMIAGMQNRGGYFIGSGPIHLIAPGGDELIERLEQKYYVLPGTRRPYMEERLVLIAPEALADAPGSFEALRNASLRVAIADPEYTQTGKLTAGFLRAAGLAGALASRLYVASDPQGVLDHLLSGDADVAIVLPRDASPHKQRVRIVAVSEANGYQPVTHSIAMERYCPDRAACRGFLDFVQSPPAQAVIRRLGYQVPGETAAK